MMDFVKRNGFLVGLVAGTVVIIIAGVLVALFMYRSPAAALERKLQGLKGQSQMLATGDVYTEGMVEEVEERSTAYDESKGGLREQIADWGAKREPMLEGLFPRLSDPALMMRSRQAYRGVIDGFLETLDAYDPERGTGEGAGGVVVGEEDLAEVTGEETESLEIPPCTMIVRTNTAFVVPDWVDAGTAPAPAQVLVGQEDLWLTEDVVGILDKLNEDVIERRRQTGEFQPGDRSLGHAPVKELLELRIGNANAGLFGGRAPGGHVRYRAAETGRRAGRRGGTGRIETLTGRVSKSGLYRVLPFRLAVIVEARYAPELVRRLKNTESFITVTAWHLQQMGSLAPGLRSNVGLSEAERELFGSRGLVRLAVSAESLVWTLPGGRVTTADEVAEAAAAIAENGGPQDQ